MELRAKITSKGRLTIPKEIREKLGVKAGDSLLFDVDDEGREATVRVERKRVSFADYEGAWREGKGMNWEEIDRYMRDLCGHDAEQEAAPDEGDVSEISSEDRKHKHR